MSDQSTIINPPTDPDREDTPPIGVLTVNPDDRELTPPTASKPARSGDREDTPPVASAPSDPDREDTPPPATGSLQTPVQTKPSNQILRFNDDEEEGPSNTSSMQTTPDHSRLFQPAPRNMVQNSSPVLGRSRSFENDVLACQLALLAALTTEMQNSVDRLERAHLKTRMQQADQIFRMVQYEAHDW